MVISLLSIRRTIVAIACSVLLSACLSGMYNLKITSEDGSKDVIITIEIADNAVERSQGLKYRDKLEDGKGMLFVFREPKILTFWMQDTLIPLDILFFDANGRFINSAEMQPCKQDPCPIYSSAEVAKYALEINRDYRRKSGIGVGWHFDAGKVLKVAKPL